MPESAHTKRSLLTIPIRWAEEHNIHPVPFVAVYVVTLILFPFSAWWFAEGIARGISLDALAVRAIVAWMLFQAPSLYILIVGRGFSRVVLLVVAVIVLILSLWRFGTMGAIIALVFLGSLLVLKLGVRLLFGKGKKGGENIHNQT